MSRANDPLLTIDDVKNLPLSEFPKMVLTNGYTSVFGFAISLTTDDFWNHFMWQISPFEVATQWWWFTRMPIDNFRQHSIKYWDNPKWTDVERKVLLQFINIRLSKTKWETHYDVWGLIRKAFGKDSPGGKDFCSESLGILSIIDPDCMKWMTENPSPRPEEVNLWLKSTGKFRVFGRVQPE
jgi:hypothetical protein